jgi:hypothetical protein
MSRSFTLTLHDSEVDSGQLQQMTRELAASINRETEIGATFPDAIPKPGQRGDPLAIGTIILQLIGSGGVIVSLVGVFKSWFERKPTLEVELQRADGAKFRLRAENLNLREIEDIRQKLDSFMSGQ